MTEKHTDSPAIARPLRPVASGRGIEPVSLLAGALWIALGVAASWKCMVAPESHTVFTKFAAGADHWWAGEPLYADYGGQGDFRYSPTFAILMTPLAALGARSGAAVWVWVNVIAFIWGLRRLARDLLPGDWPLPREGALLLLTLPGALRGIWNGQSNTLVAGLLMGAAAMVLRDRRWWTASLLALAVALKLSPIVVALLLAALWPRKLGAPLAVMLSAVVLIPFLTKPPAVVLTQYRDWLAYLRGSSEQRWPSFRDAWTLWELIHPPVHVAAYRGLQLTAGAAVLGWCLWQRRRMADLRLLITLALAMATAYLMLFGPAVEFPTYAILAPMTAWGVLTAAEQRFGRPIMLAAFILTAAVGYGAIERALSGVFPPVRAALPVGTLLFVVWLVLYAPRRILRAADAEQQREVPEVTLFTRAECQLCHAVRYVIERVAADVPLRFREVDIDAAGHEAWRELYANDIPVVHINGVEHARHRIDERALRKALRANGASGTGDQ